MLFHVLVASLEDHEPSRAETCYAANPKAPLHRALLLGHKIMS